MKHNIYATVFMSLITLISEAESSTYVYNNESIHIKTVAEALKKTNLAFEFVDSLDKEDSKNLYIICDSFKENPKNLPKHYIVYQSLNLTQNTLTNDYLTTLSNSVAIWDYSTENINQYKNELCNYYYMPPQSPYVDPITLPCNLPISELASYKELLIYSNQKNTDISSHLPALFCHAILQNPKIIIELGVRGGESTKPLHKAAQRSNAQLIGVDIDPMWVKKSYNSMSNAICIEMNDLDFKSYYTNSPFKNEKFDLIFIDTSHEYTHTLQEIILFTQFLSEEGTLVFHDSNVTPLENAGYIRLNGSQDFAPGNPRGVPQAIKEYFSIEFDEYSYVNTTFTSQEVTWHMTHYPFCNGLTIIKKQTHN